MPVLEKYLEEVYLWEYLPNFPAAITFAVIFAILTILHSWKLHRSRLWFCTPLALGGLFEVIGFSARAASTYHSGALSPFLIQAIFLLLPPVLFAGSMYMLYSQIVRAVGSESQSPINLRWATVIFISGDLTCLNVQSSGGGLLGNEDAKTVQIGTYIIVAGLILQVLVFVGFVWCCLVFHRRFRERVRSRTVPEPNVPWEIGLYVLYGTSALVLLRNIYRVVEFSMGKGSYLGRHEWPVYALDAVPMAGTMLCYIIWHPEGLLVGKHRSPVFGLIRS